jgi:hypothetical protein
MDWLVERFRDYAGLYLLFIVVVFVSGWLRFRHRPFVRAHDICDVPQTPQGDEPDGLVVLDVLLRSFGLVIARDDLRPHLEIDTSGTNINSIEDAANYFGLRAEQQIVPASAVVDPSSDVMPCIAVVEEVKGLKEFYLVWRREDDRVQVFEPSQRVRWMNVDELKSMLYQHEMQLDGRLLSGAVVVVARGVRRGLRHKEAQRNH